MLTFVSSFGQNFFIAVFGGELRRAFDLSNGQFGALYTAATIMSALALVWLGRLVDRYSLRAVTFLTLSALAAAAFLLSVSNGIVALAIALCGLRLFGQGMSTHISMTAVARWFPGRSRGKMLGLAAIGNPIGEAILPLCAVMAMAWFDWRDVWLMVAAGVSAVFLPLILAMLRGDGVRTARDNHASATGPSVAQPTGNKAQWTAREVVSHPLFYLLLPGLLAPVFINTAIYFHQVAITEAKGWPPAWFVAGYPFSSAASIIATLMAGWVADRWGSLRLLPLALLPLPVAVTLLALSNQPLVIPVYMTLAGAAMGAALTLQGAVLAELFGTEHFGAIRALLSACNVFLAASGPAIVGWMIDFGISFEAQFYGMAAYATICIGLFAISRPMAKSLALGRQPG